ncbi:SCO4402 family protein [Thermoactinospora rubra]|uniref:SCO4402 family protein n=1 Tax=Thermoactinospora rubra TaxID=1088767 RepID=UPI00117D3ACA|nr:hypothetical protein [Thermoactinospora rubra]
MRAEVLDALRVLGDRGYQERHWRNGGGWPDLTNAVHWLIDDPFLDHRPARFWIPDVFWDEREADAVQAAADALLLVLDDLGPHEPDSAYLDHPSWPQVVRAAGMALRVMETSTPPT